jgi:hypothetical protein
VQKISTKGFEKLKESLIKNEIITDFGVCIKKIKR